MAAALKHYLLSRGKRGQTSPHGLIERKLHPNWEDIDVGVLLLSLCI